MVSRFKKMRFKYISTHQDLRCGLGLINFNEVVNSFEGLNSNYPLIRFGKIATLEYGKGLTEGNRNDGEYPVMGSNGIVGSHDEFLIEGPAIIVGRKGSAGEVTYVEENCFPIDTTFYVQQTNNNYIPKFLFFLLEISKLQRLTLFKGVPGLNRYDAYEIKLPVVPIEKQEQILNKIEKIENEIYSLRQQIQEPLTIINEVFAEEFGYAKTLWRDFGKGMTAGTQKSNDKTAQWYSVKANRLMKSQIFRFSTRYHNPLTTQLNEILKSKPTIKVRDIISEPIKRGVQPRPAPDGEIYAIKTAQLKNGFLDFDDADMVLVEFFDTKERAQTRQGDVLIASTGKVSLGKVDVNELDKDAVVDGHISIVRIDEEKYDKWFVTYFLRSILGGFQIERDYTGATNQIELYSNEIENFDILDIDLDRQNAIVKIIRLQLDRQKVIKEQIKTKQAMISSVIENAIKED